MCITHTEYNEIARFAIESAIDAAQAIRNRSADLVDLVNRAESAYAAEKAAYAKLTE